MIAEAAALLIAAQPVGPIQEAWVSLWRRRDLRPIYEWARENTDLKPPLTITGPFDVNRSRHFIAPLEALQDEHTREVNILKPLRGGGTLIADIWIPWTRVNDPGPTMLLLQTDPIADDHFQKVLLPTMESVPEIKRMLAALDRHKKTGRKIEFSDGNHLHVNGPSIGNLQTNAFRYVVEDECWMYDKGRMGDAEGRTGDFQNLETSKILRISQGGPYERRTLDECEWKRAYELGSIREWEVECLHCSKRYQPVFSGTRVDGTFWGIQYDTHRHPNGDYNINRCVESVRFECPHCAKPVIDCARTKSEWNRTGDYALTTEENRKKKSFHWEAVISYPWVELVELWLSACNAERRGDLGPKLQFYQKRRAMHRDEESLLRGGMNLVRAAYEVQSKWADEQMREMSIDRQEEDLFWVMVRAWSGTESRGLYFGKCYGFGECESVRERFKVPPNLTTCDSAYNPKGDHGVYSACIKYNWIAVRGDDKWQFIHRTAKRRDVLKSYAPLTYADPESGTSKEGRRRCPLIRFSKGQMNMLVQRLIDQGVWKEQLESEDVEMAAEYAAQMASRVVKRDRNEKTGEVKVYFKEGKNDHARDLANQAALKAVLRDLVPDPAAEQLTKSEQKEAE